MNRFTLVALLLTACGESWTWDATSVSKDSGGETAAPEHDLDGDGFIDTAFGGDDCWDDPSAIPAGFEAISGTAQPTATEVHPDATESWYDGVDQDCAGDDDFDQDLDNHRSATHADGTGVTGDDCYDAVDDAYPSGAASCAREGDLAPAAVYPGATDTAYDGTDADCSGNDDFDQDGDTYGRCDECDDTNASIYPNDAPDVWYDGVDANCDGNDGDQDGDGYYIEGYAFAIPVDFEPGDCVDTEATTHPNAADAWYDGTDADCLGNDDFDQDTDGYPLSDDCDDTDGSIYVGAPDAWYDGVDSDCAGNDDFDQDSDGYNSTDDCDDLDATVNPVALEDCSTTQDDDCDGDDNDVDSVGCAAWYSDSDGDSYGSAEACLCTATTTYAIATGDDCDDADAAVNPGEVEVCNDGVDNDCDGGAGACGLTGGSVSGADAIFTGEAAGDYAGLSLAGAGDVNGDGFDDLVVGAYGNDDGGSVAGAAYVVLGSVAPASASLGTGVVYAGEDADDAAGSSVSGAGDVNGDGYDDVLVGAPYVAEGAYLVLGSASPTSASLATAVFYSNEGTQAFAGYAVAAAGDVNADGYDDVLIGSPYNDDGGQNSGAAHLVLGSGSPSSGALSAAVEYTGDFGEGDGVGWGVAGVGDVDGDGYDDLLLGSCGGNGDFYAGGACLVLGTLSPTSASAHSSVEFTGEYLYGYAGRAVGAAGDVNGDGYDDMLVGAEYANGSGSLSGAAYLMLGSTTPTSASLSTAVEYSGSYAYQRAGAAVSAAGDVDNDGYGDVLVGAPGGSNAFLVLGSTVPASASLATTATYTGESSGDYAGVSVYAAGDVNADGYADIVIGASQNDTAGTEAGAAYLFLGQGL